MLKTPLDIIIYAHDLASFLIKKDELSTLVPSSSAIRWCDSSSQNRLEEVSNFSDHWLLFLDYDCKPSRQFFESLLMLISSHAESVKTVFVGKYVNPIKSTYLQRAHNAIANTWVKHSFEKDAGPPVILGGVFLVSPRPQVRLYSGNIVPVFWGGEDIWLSQVLRSNNFDLSYAPQLSVVHHTTKSIRHFARRAWLHGMNYDLYASEGGGDNPQKYIYWFKKIVTLNLFLFPAVALHFGLQKTAKQVRKFLQPRKQTSLG